MHKDIKKYCNEGTINGNIIKILNINLEVINKSTMKYCKEGTINRDVIKILNINLVLFSSLIEFQKGLRQNMYLKMQVVLEKSDE